MFRKVLPSGVELWYVRGAGGSVPLHLYSDIPIADDHALVEAMYAFFDELPGMTIRLVK